MAMFVAETNQIRRRHNAPALGLESRLQAVVDRVPSGAGSSDAMDTSSRKPGLLECRLDGLHSIVVGRLFPPHPDPLPQGEGTASKHQSFCNTTAANLVCGSSDNRRTILPLPWGEGR